MKSMALASLILLFSLSSLQAQGDVEANMEALSESAQKFVDAFNEGDAEGIAELFIENGELVLASGEILIGRQDLLDHYSTTLAQEDRPKAALEATSVRFVSPSIATEDGTVHLTYSSGEVSSHYYTSVQVKQEDGSWLYASVRDEEGDHAMPSEKLLALQWLIGDWVIQTEDTDTWLTFKWSEDGPYIDARALTEAAGIRSTASTFRIGWNESGETFNSWAFDDQGGFTHSSWTLAGPDLWLLKTNGITAEGERHNSTQSFELDESGESFIWSQKDRIIGGVLAPDRSLRAVKRPPQPGTTASTESQ